MIVIDLFIVVFIGISLSRNKGIDLLNPLFLFLCYHIFFVTLRIIQIDFFGAEIIANQWYDRQISMDEIETAVIVSDLCLIGFYIGFRMGVTSSRNYVVNIITPYIEKRELAIKYLLYITIVAGIVGLVMFSAISSSGNEAITSEGIGVVLLRNAAVTSGILLIYLRGFKPLYLVYIGVMLAVFALLGEQRFRVVLPLIFLGSLYIKKKNIRKIPKKMFFAAALVLIVTSPLKTIGRKFQSNEKIELANTLEESYFDLAAGESGDLSFLEQSAAMISNVDIRGDFFYGETFLPILFFWIPKSLWEEKPTLNEWQKEISTSGRDFGELGQISLLSGEGYANFSFYGAFLVPLFVGRWYSYLFSNFREKNYNHKGFLALLLFNMILFQVWRDGLISLFLFPILNYLPIFILILLKKNDESSIKNVENSIKLDN